VIRIGGVNAVIHNRLGLLPTYLVRPDGGAFALAQQAVLDELGISGIADQADCHLGVQLAAIGAFTGVEVLPDIVRQAIGAEGQQDTNATAMIPSSRMPRRFSVPAGGPYS